ncbi:hypothetical protein WJR50_19075 [Catalinimonas sp. 4WD22]|uniref:hypothetical protein n=1 Tax=Catalinimonas locisalis TaxID=3133978 RepID=UPI003101077C
MNRKISTSKLKHTALAATVLFTAACMPEDDFRDIEVLAPSPSLSLPILNTNLKVSDLIRTDDGGLLEKNSDGSYSLFYRQNIQSKMVGEYFPPIPSQQFSDNVSLGLSAPAFSLAPEPVSFEGEIPLELGELTLYKIECKQGELSVAINSDYNHDLNVTLTLPEILDANEEPLILDFNLPSWASNYSIQTKDLAGYSLNIDQEKINYIMEVSIVGSGNAIDATDKIYFDLNMMDIDFSYLEGNFKEISIPVDADTLKIPFLANAVNGEVALNPNLKLDFINSFGAPIAPDFSNIYVKRKSGVVVQLEDEGESHFFSGEYEFPYLQDRNELPAMKTQLVDRTNSNLEDAFAELPRGIAYLFGFELNSTEGDTSFVSENSSIGIDMEVELPLEGRFDIVLEDTIAVDLGFDQEVEELKVLIKTENGFPIDAGLQIFFLDKEGDKIYDSNGQAVRLFGEDAQLLKAAQIVNSATGETKSTSIDMPISATINAEMYDLIKQAGSMLVQASLQSESEDEDLIKLYDNYNIRFSLAMQIKSSLNLSN